MGYLLDERETHLYYDPVLKLWKAWTNMPEFANKMRKFGWTLTETGKVSGEEVDWTFEIDKPKAVRLFDMTKPPRKTKPASQKSLDALREFNAKRREANNVSESN